MLGHGVEPKSLHIDIDSDWKYPDARYKSEFLKKVRDKMEYKVINYNAPQNIRVDLMRLWSDGFQPDNVITLSSSSPQLFVVTMAHAITIGTKIQTR